VCTRERDCYEIRILNECPKCACGCCPDPKSGQTQDTTQQTAANTKKTSKKKTSADLVEGTGADVKPVDCWCVDPTLPCYKDHYAGKCGCECCDDEWIILARLWDKSGGQNTEWTPDHTVRRFVRPVLMRDPVAWAESHPPEGS